MNDFSYTFLFIIFVSKNNKIKMEYVCFIINKGQNFFFKDPSTRATLFLLT